MLDELDDIIRASLRDFSSAIFTSDWRGREREAVSLYAFGYLQHRCRPGGILRDPTQIGVEVAVPGVPGRNPKGRVNKDLVLWPAPQMTAWNASWALVNQPLAVMEWKLFRHATQAGGLSQYDLDWLIAFSRDRAQFVGYAVAVDLAARRFKMRIARCHRGEADLAWMEV